MSSPLPVSKNDRWVIAQRWKHVLFMSYDLDPGCVQAALPEGLEVDLFEGRAWLSVVPFFMSHIRFPYTPPCGWIGLRELNLRTYVRYRNQPGIYFFTLDTDSFLGQWIARRFFHLPYRFRCLKGAVSGREYHFESENSLTLRATIGEPCAVGSFDRWLVERYSLFTRGKDAYYRGDVLHTPWKLNQIKDAEVSDALSGEFGFTSKAPWHMRYAAELDVRFRPFTKLL